MEDKKLDLSVFEGFTPGPWIADEYGGFIWSEQPGKKMVGEVRGWGWIQYLSEPEKLQDANKKLLAAAPDILDYAKHLETQLAKKDAEIERLRGEFAAIGTYAGTHSHGPELPDKLWTVRCWAYDAMEEKP